MPILRTTNRSFKDRLLKLQGKTKISHEQRKKLWNDMNNKRFIQWLPNDKVEIGKLMFQLDV